MIRATTINRVFASDELIGTSQTGKRFVNVKFTGNVCNATFLSCDFYNCTFENAMLDYTVFEECSFSDCNFKGCTIRQSRMLDTSFNRCVFDKNELNGTFFHRKRDEGMVRFQSCKGIILVRSNEIGTPHVISWVNRAGRRMYQVGGTWSESKKEISNYVSKRPNWDGKYVLKLMSVADTMMMEVSNG